MEEIKLYHCTPVGGLTELDPALSKGGFNYVSATKFREYALLYATANNKKNLDGAYGVNNVPYFIEFYPGSLEHRFKGLPGYIYEVDPSTFDLSKNRAETRSYSKVKILNCKYIEDVYEEILKAEKEGKIKLVRYNSNKEFQSYIKWNIKFF